MTRLLPDPPPGRGTQLLRQGRRRSDRPRHRIPAAARNSSLHDFAHRIAAAGPGRRPTFSATRGGRSGLLCDAVGRGVYGRHAVVAGRGRGRATASGPSTGTPRFEKSSSFRPYTPPRGSRLPRAVPRASTSGAWPCYEALLRTPAAVDASAKQSDKLVGDAPGVR